ELSRQGCPDRARPPPPATAPQVPPVRDLSVYPRGPNPRPTDPRHDESYIGGTCGMRAYGLFRWFARAVLPLGPNVLSVAAVRPEVLDGRSQGSARLQLPFPSLGVSCPRTQRRAVDGDSDRVPGAWAQAGRASCLSADQGIEPGKRLWDGDHRRT